MYKLVEIYEEKFGTSRIFLRNKEKDNFCNMAWYNFIKEI